MMGFKELIKKTLKYNNILYNEKGEYIYLNDSKYNKIIIYVDEDNFKTNIRSSFTDYTYRISNAFFNLDIDEDKNYFICALLDGIKIIKNKIVEW